MERKAIRLLEFLDGLLFSKWSVANIEGLHLLARDYPRAISVALAFQPTFKRYDEVLLHELLHDTRKKLDLKLEKLRSFLTGEGVRHQFIPHGGQDPTTLRAMFPHKLAATRAGLGWIGKNSLLITEEFGPRVHLSTILLDVEAECGRPITTSECGNCRSCVDACPYDCLHDTIWRPGTERSQLFDAFTCSLKREAYIPRLGRKHECGLCLFACPQPHRQVEDDLLGPPFVPALALN